MHKEELITELKQLGKEIRECGREKNDKNDKKLERITQIIDILIEQMQEDEFCMLLTEINSEKDTDKEMEM